MRGCCCCCFGVLVSLLIPRFFSVTILHSQLAAYTPYSSLDSPIHLDSVCGIGFISFRLGSARWTPGGKYDGRIGSERDVVYPGLEIEISYVLLVMVFWGYAIHRRALS